MKLLEELEQECRRVGIINKINQIKSHEYYKHLSELSQEDQDQLTDILANTCNNNLKFLKYCLINHTLDIHPKCPICGKNKKFNYHAGYFFDTCGSKECIKEQYRLTNLIKYGTENPMQSKVIRDKAKQTNLRKYGVEYLLQDKDIRLKASQTRKNKTLEEKKATQEKVEQTSIKRFGTRNPSQNKDIKNKISQSLKNRTLEEKRITQEKREQTNLERYNIKHPAQLDIFKEKTKQINIKRYGVEYFVLSDNFDRYSCRYYYNNIYFDSSYELVFYKWCIDNNISITREPTRFEYYDNNNNNKHYYYPDFKISHNNRIRLIEISSNYTWSTKSEQKKKLIKDNNILVLLDKDIQQYFDYCENIRFNYKDYKINNKEV